MVAALIYNCSSFAKLLKRSCFVISVMSTCSYILFHCSNHIFNITGLLPVSIVTSIGFMGKNIGGCNFQYMRCTVRSRFRLNFIEKTSSSDSKSWRFSVFYWSDWPHTLGKDVEYFIFLANWRWGTCDWTLLVIVTRQNEQVLTVWSQRQVLPGSMCSVSCWSAAGCVQGPTHARLGVGWPATQALLEVAHSWQGRSGGCGPSEKTHTVWVTSNTMDLFSFIVQ